MTQLQIFLITRRAMNKETKLFIFRHGETDWNIRNIIQGSNDISLNQNGRIQAIKLADKLRNKGIECILSSSQIRAVETATIVCNELKIPLYNTPDLAEINYGLCEGKFTPDIQKEYPKYFATIDDIYNDNFYNASLPRGETRRHAFERSMFAISSFCKTSQKLKVIGISSHGGVIATLLAKCFENKAKVNNCDYFECTYSHTSNKLENLQL